MCPNRLDDVELVRFGYYCAKVSVKIRPLISPRMRTSLDVMQSKGPYRPDLQNVIDAHQQVRGGTKDGKVSVGKPQVTHSFSYDSKHSWIIFGLTLPMVEYMPDEYPRIDVDDQSGPEISKRVRELFRIE